MMIRNARLSTAPGSHLTQGERGDAFAGVGAQPQAVRGTRERAREIENRAERNHQLAWQAPGDSPRDDALGRPGVVSGREQSKLEMLRVEGAILHVDPVEACAAAREIEVTERDLEQVLSSPAEQEHGRIGRTGILHVPGKSGDVDLRESRHGSSSDCATGASRLAPAPYSQGRRSPPAAKLHCRTPPSPPPTQQNTPGIAAGNSRVCARGSGFGWQRIAPRARPDRQAGACQTAPQSRAPG